MPLLTNQDATNKATGTSLTYITIGAILAVFSGTSFFFFNAPFRENDVLGYIRWATLILGIVLLLIGFGVGAIARTAKPAEEPTTAELVAREATANQARAHAQRTKTG
jgi:sulfite exporter TauE/SafE